MSRDKQIEEMALTDVDILANDINQHCPDLKENYCGYIHCVACLAHALTAKGYRKASDVARGIFEEIEQNLNNLIRYYKEKRNYVTEIEYSEFEQRYCDIKIRTFEDRLLKIAELKKKYTEGEANG